MPAGVVSAHLESPVASAASGFKSRLRRQEHPHCLWQLPHNRYAAFVLVARPLLDRRWFSGDRWLKRPDGAHQARQVLEVVLGLVAVDQALIPRGVLAGL